MFQVFYLSFLYVASVASECFKSRSGVAHGICVGSERGREQSSSERRLGGVGPPWARVTQARSRKVRATRAHAWPHETKEKPTHGRPDASACPDVRALE